jgi:hypothetical protein
MQSNNINAFKYTATTTSVGSLINDLNRDKKIILDPVYQRAVVWEKDNYVKFIESVFMGVASPNITFTDNKEGRICIDGKQRCTSLKKFYNNEFPIELDGELYYFSQVNENKEHKNKTPKVLTSEHRREFEKKLLNIVEYTDLSYQDQAEIFARLQYGKNLTSGEIIISKIQNEEVSKNYNSYCQKHALALKKYFTSERKDNYKYITELMYLINSEIGSAITKKSIDKFLSNLTKKEFNNLTIIVDKIINKVFTDDILKKEEIYGLGLSKSDELLIIPYKVYTKIIKDNIKIFGSDDINNIIIQCHKKFKKLEKRGKQKAVLSKMSEIFDEEFQKIYEEKLDESNSEISDSEEEKIPAKKTVIHKVRK